MKVGDLFFVSGTSLISKAIKIVSTGRTHDLEEVPSHVAIVWHIFDDKVLLLEANFRKVEIVPIKKYRKYKTWIASMKEPRDIPKGLKWAFQQEGMAYDFTAILGILLRSTFRIFGPEVYMRVKFMRNLLEERVRFFCSELASTYGQMTGNRLCSSHASVTTPYDLFRSDEINKEEV